MVLINRIFSTLVLKNRQIFLEMYIYLYATTRNRTVAIITCNTLKSAASTLSMPMTTTTLAERKLARDVKVAQTIRKKPMYIALQNEVHFEKNMIYKDETQTSLYHRIQMPIRKHPPATHWSPTPTQKPLLGMCKGTLPTLKSSFEILFRDALVIHTSKMHRQTGGCAC